MKRLFLISLCTTIMTASVFAKPLKTMNCLDQVVLENKSIYVKVAKREIINMDALSKLEKIDWSLSREFHKAHSRMVERGSNSVDVENIEDALERYEKLSLDGINETYSLNMIESLYRMTPSSRDKKEQPFGSLGIPREGFIQDHCAAQMNPFYVEGRSGTLYGITNRGNKIMIATPVDQLVDAQQLDSTFGQFVEYRLVNGLEMIKAQVNLKRNSRVYWDRGEFELNRDTYEYKEMLLKFKNTQTGDIYKFRSFDKN